MIVVDIIKKLWYIIKHYDSDLQIAHQRIGQLEHIIKERTDIGADIHYRGDNYIIVVGRYKNTDYIRTYTISGPDMVDMVDRLKHMSKYGNIKCIDAPPQMRWVFDNEIFK